MPKYDLSLSTPIMNAAGTLGFAPPLRGYPLLERLGAFVTNPVSLAPRTPAHGMRYLPCAGGFLLHTGYPNPGLSRVIRRYAQKWEHSSVPVIVNMIGQNAEEIAYMARRLERVEGVAALEVGLPKDADTEMVSALIAAACGELPVIARLPMEQATALAGTALAAGATMISLGPPRGLLPSPEGGLLQGRFYGPALFPLALAVTRELVQIGAPTIGAGGIYAQEHTDAMLAVGALAVQVDGVLWKGAFEIRAPSCPSGRLA